MTSARSTGPTNTQSGELNPENNAKIFRHHRSTGASHANCLTTTELAAVKMRLPRH
jgi:hypothetical protein